MRWLWPEFSPAPQAPESDAVRILRREGAPSLAQIAALAGVSDATVSRGLAGIYPLDPRIVGVLRVLVGADVAERVAAQAELARLEHLRAEVLS